MGMYEWIAIPPNKKFMESVEKHESFLNGVIVKHRRELELKKQKFEKRKKLINDTQPTKDTDGR